jgi:hypothetical protein
MYGKGQSLFSRDDIAESLQNGGVSLFCLYCLHDHRDFLLCHSDEDFAACAPPTGGWLLTLVHTH